MFPSLAFAAATAAATLVTATASAQTERVCREVCAGGTCRQECVETQGRGERRDRDVIIEDRRPDPAPGVGIVVPVPVPDIRIGPSR